MKSFLKAQKSKLKKKKTIVRRAEPKGGQWLAKGDSQAQEPSLEALASGFHVMRIVTCGQRHFLHNNPFLLPTYFRTLLT